MGVPAAVLVFAVGLLAGLLSGLVGIGGGVLMVPFLYFFYAHPELSGVTLPHGAATVAAHATSLFVILPTSVRGALAFHRAGLVVWRAVWPIAAASALAAAVASQAATVLPPSVLRLGFGVLLLFSSVQLFRRGRKAEPGAEDAPPRPLRLSLPVTAGTGAVIGTLSALMGVGGGFVGIPLLIGVVGVELRRVAATSMGIITLTSAAGAAAYMAAGPAQPIRSGWSVGYVDLATGAVLAAGALLAVGLGASINRRLDPRALARLFGAFFAVLGAWLVADNLFF